MKASLPALVLLLSIPSSLAVTGCGDDSSSSDAGGGPPASTSTTGSGTTTAGSGGAAATGTTTSGAVTGQGGAGGGSGGEGGGGDGGQGGGDDGEGYLAIIAHVGGAPENRVSFEARLHGGEITPVFDAQALEATTPVFYPGLDVGAMNVPAGVHTVSMDAMLVASFCQGDGCIPEMVEVPFAESLEVTIEEGETTFVVLKADACTRPDEPPVPCGGIAAHVSPVMRDEQGLVPPAVFYLRGPATLADDLPQTVGVDEVPLCDELAAEQIAPGDSHLFFVDPNADSHLAIQTQFGASRYWLGPLGNDLPSSPVRREVYPVLGRFISPMGSGAGYELSAASCGK